MRNDDKSQSRHCNKVRSFAVYPLETFGYQAMPARPIHDWNRGSRAERIRQYCAIGAMLALIAAIGAAQAAEPVSIRASSRGSAVEIEARATLRAPHALIWQTLTDYDHLSDFIPGMLKSQVIDRRGNATIIEQSGNATIPFFNYIRDQFRGMVREIERREALRTENRARVQ